MISLSLLVKQFGVFNSVRDHIDSPGPWVFKYLQPLEIQGLCIKKTLCFFLLLFVTVLKLHCKYKIFPIKIRNVNRHLVMVAYHPEQFHLESLIFCVNPWLSWSAHILYLVQAPGLPEAVVISLRCDFTLSISEINEGVDV